MKTLVTGTPGWLASRLIEVLKAENRNIRCLVQPNVDAGSLSELGVEIVRGDVTSPQSLRGICKDVVTVFHCAGIIHPRNPRQFYEINTFGTKNLLEEAIKEKVEKFIYVSSSSAGAGYGASNPTDESKLGRPFMDYGLSKIKAEQALNNVCSEGKIKTVVIRPHWLYGLGVFGRQLGFVKMIKKGRPLLFGNGKNYRSLCDVHNCVQALILAEKSEKAVGQTYYIADEKPYQLLYLYNTVAKLLNIEIRPRSIYTPVEGSLLYDVFDRFMQGLRFYFPEIHLAFDWAKNIVSSIDKAKAELGYSPRIDFEKGMRDAIDWYKANNNI